MPSKMSYGVELEFLGIRNNDAVEALNDGGVEARNDGYHHERRRYWRVTEDGSVNGSGLELVSPILGRSTTLHTTQVKKATKSLREAGAVVDTSCGLHVHHSLSDLEIEDVAQAAGYYTVFQEVIDSVLPRSRKGTSATAYAQPMGSWGTAETWVRRVREVPHFRSDRAYNFGRYHGVNINSMPTHGTLEFRQHSGTLNAAKVLHWTRFTRLFMDLRAHGVPDVMEDTGKYAEIHTIEEVIRHLAGTMDRRTLRPMVEFYNERAAKFAVTGTDEEDVSNDGTNYEHDGRDEEDDGEHDESLWCDSCGVYHDE